jgi:hypothetical protein
MLKAGYSESTALQQKVTRDFLQGKTAMKEALEKHGVTEDTLAKKISDDIKKLPPGKAALG